MRITLSSSFRDMAYDYYLKHPMRMCEIKLNQILAKNPRLVYRLDTYSIYPYTRKGPNQEMIFVNEKQ